MAEHEIVVRCGCRNVTCLICNLITSVAPRDCAGCSPGRGRIGIWGADACGDPVAVEYGLRSATLKIRASAHVIERHAQVIKTLLPGVDDA